MALVKPVIFQVIGYKNSGKTTFVSKLISLLKDEGLTVVSIKHHGHGGMPDVDESKDSSRHLDSGAAAAIIEGEGRLVLQAERKSWTLEDKIQLLGFFKPDIILIEGFKKGAYPKAVMIRNELDEGLITTISNVKTAVFWKKSPPSSFTQELPSFQIDDPGAVKWAINYIKNQLYEENS